MLYVGTGVFDGVQFTGLDYVSAPIFGRPDAVAARKVVVVLAGSSAAKDRVRPLLEVLGRGIIGDPLHVLMVQGFHFTNILWRLVFATACKVDVSKLRQGNPGKLHCW